MLWNPIPTWRWSPCLAALLGLAMFATAAQAQWTWRDKEGRITASDLPPPRDVPDKDILTRPAPATSAAASNPATPAPPVERELEARKKAAEAERAAQTKTDDAKQAAARADNCRRARAQLAAMDSGQRIARLNDKGEREVLDDKGRAEESRRAREVMASDCR
jgi:type IV secretory pathway VirB10-like protein